MQNWKVRGSWENFVLSQQQAHWICILCHVKPHRQYLKKHQKSWQKGIKTCRKLNMKEGHPHTMLRSSKFNYYYGLFVCRGFWIIFWLLCKQQVVESVKSGQFTKGEDNTGLSVRWGVVFTVVEYSTRWSLDKSRWERCLCSGIWPGNLSYRKISTFCLWVAKLSAYGCKQMVWWGRAYRKSGKGSAWALKSAGYYY